MKILSLLRHAKSSWDIPSIKDFDRPLNDRGRQSAMTMGAFMKASNLIPDIIFCSTSKRTRETLDLLSEPFEKSPEVVFDDKLYHGEPKQLLDAARSAPDSIHHALVIAHNPGMHELSLTLAARPQSSMDMVRLLASKFPTAALAVFDLNIEHWKQAGPEYSSLRLFQRPRDL